MEAAVLLLVGVREINGNDKLDLGASVNVIQKAESVVLFNFDQLYLAGNEAVLHHPEIFAL